MIVVLEGRDNNIANFVNPCLLLFQRRDYRVLAECLPPKQEYVLAIRLSPIQDQLYRHFLEHGTGMHTQQDIFSTFANFSKVGQAALFGVGMRKVCLSLSHFMNSTHNGLSISSRNGRVWYSHLQPTCARYSSQSIE